MAASQNNAYGSLHSVRSLVLDDAEVLLSLHTLAQEFNTRKNEYTRTLLGFGQDLWVLRSYLSETELDEFIQSNSNLDLYDAIRIWMAFVDSSLPTGLHADFKLPLKRIFSRWQRSMSLQGYDVQDLETYALYISKLRASLQRTIASLEALLNHDPYRFLMNDLLFDNADQDANVLADYISAIHIDEREEDGSTTHQLFSSGGCFDIAPDYIEDDPLLKDPNHSIKVIRY